MAQETLYSDYRETDGVLFAHKSEKREVESGKLMQTIVITGIESNPVIDRDTFVRPD